MPSPRRVRPDCAAHPHGIHEVTGYEAKAQMMNFNDDENLNHNARNVTEAIRCPIFCSARSYVLVHTLSTLISGQGWQHCLLFLVSFIAVSFG